MVTHVPKLLDLSVDIEDASTPWGRWWRDGYELRNRVVHGGHRPNANEAMEAVSSSMDLVAAVGRAVEGDPDLGDLAFGLPTGVGET